jgi:hypothetical protein
MQVTICGHEPFNFERDLAHMAWTGLTCKRISVLCKLVCMLKQMFTFMQELARQSGVRNLSMYICNFDLPLQDIRAGRVPPVASHLLTVIQVIAQSLVGARLLLAGS